jgi:7-cyano-7-deazaguanine synthase in queuosine biosynthesis/predicted glutamine amidotransferase
MCGIFGFFNLGSKKINVPDILLNGAAMEAQKRGRDGWGVMLDGEIYKSTKQDSIINFKQFGTKKEFCILNCRAKPETEVETSLENIQPISHKENRKEAYLVHNGAISESYMKYVYKKHHWKPSTKIDSEALLTLSFKDGVNKKTLSEIDGGFAFIYMELFKKNLLEVSVACKYQPLYILEVSKSNDEKIIFFHSLKSGLEVLKDYYKSCDFQVFLYEMPSYSYRSYSILDKEEVHGTFEPYFEYPQKSKSNGKIKVLCSCSGGIDSTTSLILSHKLLKENQQDFDIDMIHYMYGHRGQEAELNAVKRIHKYLKEEKDINVNLKLVNLEDMYKNIFNVKNSQLINDKSEIETGTKEKLKSTIAWVPIRNMLFQVIMFGLGETYILEEGYDKVYMVAGWNQLSEEGFYPDNSTRFSNTMMEAAKYGTLVGHKLKTWNICAQLLKSDQWLLAKELGFLDVFKYTISCDIPVKDGDRYYNCNGQCGSTLLSMWASKRYKDIKDPRQFKEAMTTIKKSNLYKMPKQDSLTIDKNILNDVISRIILIDEVKQIIKDE